MKTFFVFATVLLLLFSCKHTQTAKRPVSYSLTLQTKAKPTFVVLHIHIHGNYHFNKDYPARVQIQDKGGLDFSSTTVNSNRFKSKTSTIDVSIPLKSVPSPGKYRPIFKMSFSLCSKDECLVLRNEQFQGVITVK